MLLKRQKLGSSSGGPARLTMGPSGNDDLIVRQHACLLQRRCVLPAVRPAARRLSRLRLLLRACGRDRSHDLGTTVSPELFLIRRILVRIPCSKFQKRLRRQSRNQTEEKLMEQDTAEQFNPETGVWTALPSMAQANSTRSWDHGFPGAVSH